MTYRSDMTTLQQIIILLLSHQDKTVLLDTPVIVRKGQVSIFECWGVAIAGDGVWLMDETADWFEVKEHYQNADIVISAIYDRLKDLESKAA